MKKVFISVLSLVFLSILNSTHASANIEDFSDAASVPVWATGAFKELLAEDIISGTGQHELNPLATINRAEFTKILTEATHQTLIDPRRNTFNDVHPKHWFYPYIETAADLGWVTGYNNGDFKPGNSINRAEIAKLINQAFELNAKVEPSDLTWYDAEVRALETNNLLPYNVDQSNFEAAVTPTRAEVFDQIYRALPSIEAQKKSEDIETNSNASTENTETLFEAPQTFISTTKEAKAGNLNVSNIKNKNANISVGQKSASLGTYNFQASNGSVRMEGLQLRRIGNGNISNYTTLWLELNGQKITAMVSPSDDLIIFNFTNPSVISSGKTLSVQLKGDVSSQAPAGSSERFVLYLPTWVNANTQNIIGFFPLAGANITIR